MMNGAQPGRTALIVEDDPAIRELLTGIIEDAGFATTSCELGQAGLTALTQGPFDLLLIDQWLPDMNGLQICAAAKHRYGRGPLVIMITADARIERHVTALTTCADDVVTKPFDIDLLTARIEAKLRPSRHIAA